uniref:Embryonic stem cell-specific 5-hydroxymethylcytosine-binding protein n=1 Tax=Chloropicon laureae TaxID=464258 RepID=A0A7S2YZK9_9CHLO
MFFWEKPKKLRRRRCIVPVNGFYEWKKEGASGKTKQPYLVYAAAGEKGAKGQPESIMYLAGLYDVWFDTGSQQEEFTYTILTTEPLESVAWLHNRMPVIKMDWSEWLDCSGAGDDGTGGKGDLTAIGKLAGAVHMGQNQLQWHAVTPKMGNVRYDSKECSLDMNRNQKTLSLFGAPPSPGSAPQEAVGGLKLSQGGSPALSKRRKREEDVSAATEQRTKQQQKQKQKQQRRHKSPKATDKNQRSSTSFFK